MSVADLVSALTSRVRKRATEQQTTAFQRFRDELLRPLATGQKVDDDLAEEILAEVERSPEQLAEDVEKYSQREKNAAKAATKADWERRMAEAEALHAKLNAEFIAYRDQISPKIQAAWTAARAAEAEINTCNWAIAKLTETVMDPSIAAREQEMSARRTEIGLRQRGLQQQQEEAQKRIGYYQARVDGISERASDVAEHKAELRQWRQRLGELEAELRGVNAELAALQPEYAKIQAYKLVP